MHAEPLILLTILGMALATYLTRAGGLFLMSFITPSPRVEAWLRQIPGAVLISIIAPTVFLSSLAQTLAALITLLAAIYTKNLLVAIIAGVAAVSLLRLAL
ncbi:MAG TPA: AzlD domain-containing protein [Ktedonobacteraceae bacterium]|nr:AzlD domain-containing protein [Ktedonobacteraceae bacterium]